jgi:hypothetical protein
MIHTDPPRARCEGQSYLFESVHADDHRLARQECVNPDGTPLCPLFALTDVHIVTYRRPRLQDAG